MHERDKKKGESLGYQMLRKKNSKKEVKQFPLSLLPHTTTAVTLNAISHHFHHRVVKRKRQRRIKEEENDDEESKKKKFKDDEYKLEFFNGVRKRKKRASDAKRTVDASFRIVRL